LDLPGGEEEEDTVLECAGKVNLLLALLEEEATADAA